MFELYKGNYNSLYSHLFQLTKNQHNINTRQAAAGKFCTPVVRTNYKKHFITYSGVKIWNTIPENIRNSRQKKSFSKLYKKMLLNNY